LVQALSNFLYLTREFLAQLGFEFGYIGLELGFEFGHIGLELGYIGLGSEVIVHAFELG